MAPLVCQQLPQAGPHDACTRTVGVGLTGPRVDHATEWPAGDGRSCAVPGSGFELGDERPQVVGHQLWRLDGGDVAAARHPRVAARAVEPLRPLAQPGALVGVLVVEDRQRRATMTYSRAPMGELDQRLSKPPRRGRPALARRPRPEGSDDRLRSDHPSGPTRHPATAEAAILPTPLKVLRGEAYSTPRPPRAPRLP